jgi:hypothetical protein
VLTADGDKNNMMNFQNGFGKEYLIFKLCDFSDIPKKLPSTNIQDLIILCW